MYMGVYQNGMDEHYEVSFITKEYINVSDHSLYMASNNQDTIDTMNSENSPELDYKEELEDQEDAIYQNLNRLLQEDKNNST